MIGLQSALTAGIALPALYLSPFSDLMGYGALGALVSLFGRFAPKGQRLRIVALATLCQIAAVMLVSAAAWLGAPTVMLMALLALACGVFYFIVVSENFGPPGALIFVFAAGAGMAPVDSGTVVFERGAAVLVVALLALLICGLSERLRGEPSFIPPIEPRKARLVASVRIIVGAAVALAVGVAAGAHHPVWAAMGALAVMQGAHLNISMSRALQRMAGTVIGALMTWVLLSQEPSVWVVIAVVVCLQFVTELIIGANYGLGQILVTPMALLMTHLAAPAQNGTQMVPERILDTLIGAGVGMIVAILMSSWRERRSLARHHARQTKGE